MNNLEYKTTVLYKISELLAPQKKKKKNPSATMSFDLKWSMTNYILNTYFLKLCVALLRNLIYKTSEDF